MEKEKVIFDTNIIRNTNSTHLLGGREELKKFSKVAEIIIPEIVIEELKYQKRKQLEYDKMEFLKNPFHQLLNNNRSDAEHFDIEAHIADLEQQEEISYSVIKLNDPSVLEKIKELAIKKLPPFEGNDKTDKGFKDAYIYFTILEYTKTIKDKYIFVCTNDQRLKEALKKHPNIKVINNYEGFKDQCISSLCDEYFISKLKDVLNLDIKAENIKDYWVNINEDTILLVEIEDEKIVIEIDSREIISYANKKEYDEDIRGLIKSDCFSTTHSKVAKLEKYKKYFSDEDIEKILGAATTNNQIYWIIKDNDVKQFISSLFEGKKEMLENEMREKVENLLKS